LWCEAYIHSTERLMIDDPPEGCWDNRMLRVDGQPVPNQAKQQASTKGS